MVCTCTQAGGGERGKGKKRKEREKTNLRPKVVPNFCEPLFAVSVGDRTDRPVEWLTRSLYSHGGTLPTTSQICFH